MTSTTSPACTSSGTASSSPYGQRRWERGGLAPLSREQLAAAADVSVAHLSRLFRQECGLGPSRALEWVRLRRALVLPSRGSMSVREIALAVGRHVHHHGHLGRRAP